jgi:hypothetical protein
MKATRAILDTLLYRFDLVSDPGSFGIMNDTPVD